MIGVITLIRVIKNWSALWDEEVTRDDLRLARSAAFFLLLPPAVALHELGHAAMVWAHGKEVVDFIFLGYMGAVMYRGEGGTLADFSIALAGNVVTVVLGLAAALYGFRVARDPIRRAIAVELGGQSLFLVLVFYPLICLFGPGDFRVIYDFEATPIASGVTALVHGVLVVILARAWPREEPPPQPKKKKGAFS